MLEGFVALVFVGGFLILAYTLEERREEEPRKKENLHK